MTETPDSSIVVAALVADHVAHEAAEAALHRCNATIVHVAVEAYSVLTRLPPPHRLTFAVAAGLIDARLAGRMVSLDAQPGASVPRRLAAAGIFGGATYDGIIAITALAHGLRLVSRDRRAARTYRALGVSFQLIE